MKKLFALIMIVIGLFAFTGCGNISVNITGTTNTGPVEAEVFEDELSSVIERIYDIKDTQLALGNLPVDLESDDSVNFYTGLENADKIEDVLVSETMIGSQAYSVVLVKVKNIRDVNSIANEMLEGIDQRKWICVGADDMQVVARGRIVMLVMVDTVLEDLVTSQEIVDAFTEVAGGKLDLELIK